MPILDIEIVLRPGEALPADLAKTLAELATQVFGAAPGTIWVKLKTIDADNYAENGVGTETYHPVFVGVLKAKLPTLEQIQAEVTALTAVIAEACGRPQENVHVLYEPEGAGRIAFGGKLRGSS
ncbi:MAG: hypothetical protein L0228_14610 [Planctomycetes bacterium]|nr:hypothetical protein [Planctomycetota bacterium]